MMEPQAISVAEVLQQRRSIRSYRDQPVSRKLIEQILVSAQWAPSAHNRQPWRFVIIEQVHHRERLAAAMGARLRTDLLADGVPLPQIEADCARSRKRILAAPVLILICLSMVDMDAYPDEKRAQAEFLMAVQSVAMAGQNLMLAAHAAGLASCWLCAPLFCPQTVTDCLDLPEDWQAQGLITLGYAADQREKSRKPIVEALLWR
ncbi:MAG: nitroreductase family protein [Chloroflexi bacterium]|nr:nitroreductase family protein [Chloroflexota bacterium]